MRFWNSTEAFKRRERTAYWRGSGTRGRFWWCFYLISAGKTFLFPLLGDSQVSVCQSLGSLLCPPSVWWSPFLPTLGPPRVPTLFSLPASPDGGFGLRNHHQLFIRGHVQSPGSPGSFCFKYRNSEKWSLQWVREAGMFLSYSSNEIT